jgi:hypothetical protein
MHHSQLFVEIGSAEICPLQGWPQTAILPISASQAAKITGVSHWHSAAHCNFFKGAKTKQNKQNIAT